MTRRRASDRLRRLGLVVALGAAVALTGASAVGQTRRQHAEAMLRTGNQLYDQGDYEGALQRYRAAQELFPSYKIDYNIGVALQALKQPVQALPHFERFLRQAQGRAEAKKIDLCKRRIARLRLEVSGIRLSGAPPGAEVRIDGERVAQPPVDDEIYLLPGRHRVKVSLEGFLTFEQALQLEPGDHPAVTVRLRPREEHVGPRTDQLPPPAPPPPRRRVWTWVLTSAAAAALGVAVAFSILAKNEYDDYTNLATQMTKDQYWDRRSSIEHKELGANICYGAAGALAVGALVLFFVEPHEHRAVGARSTLHLQLGRGLSLSGSF